MAAEVRASMSRPTRVAQASRLATISDRLEPDISIHRIGVRMAASEIARDMDIRCAVGDRVPLVRSRA